MEDSRGRVLPAYLVADESGSMSGVVKDLNQGLKSLKDQIQLETMAAAAVRLAILGFSDKATWHMDLSDLRSEAPMPSLGSYGGTSYAAAFQALRGRLPSDVAELKKQGYSVHRPAVFFLSDGNPNPEDWHTPLNELKSPDFREHPNIIAFGFGQVTAQTLLDVATHRDYAFIAAKGVDVGQALVELFEALTRSFILSGQQVATGQGNLVIEQPKTFTMAIDTL